MPTAMVEDWKYTRVDLTVDLTTIYTGACILGNVWVTGALDANACPIQDGAGVIVSVPASAAVGDAVTYAKGTRLTTSLVVNPADAAAQGEIIVQWRPG